MRKIASSAIACLLLGVYAAPAHAQPQPVPGQLARTFVSSMGNDANDCGRLTPCRTFQRAHDNTLPLGEITVLDPGGYGAVNITKGISIINDGVGEAGVLVSGGLIGITVNAGAFDRVTLRGLTVKGIGFGGGNGIRFNTAASLSIENCVIRNHTGDGVQMLGNVSGVSTFTLSNTVVSDNGGNGIFIRPNGPSTLNVVLNGVEMYNNGAHGFAVIASEGRGVVATVTDSVSGGNGLSGFFSQAVMVVKRSLATSNADRGFLAETSATFLSDSVATLNGAEGWTGNRTVGIIFSYQDNLEYGNGGNSQSFPTNKK